MRGDSGDGTAIRRPLSPQAALDRAPPPWKQPTPQEHPQIRQCPNRHSAQGAEGRFHRRSVRNRRSPRLAARLWEDWLPDRTMRFDIEGFHSARADREAMLEQPEDRAHRNSILPQNRGLSHNVQPAGGESRQSTYG